MQSPAVAVHQIQKKFCGLQAERIELASSHQTMKSLSLFCWLGLLWAFSCTRVTEEPGVVPFEKQTGPLPLFSVEVDSIHRTQTLRFDSIAQGGNFNLTFTPFRFGKIRIVENGRAVQLQMDTGRWQKDSSQYTICKNAVCRSGWLWVRNKSYVPAPVDTTDTTDTLPVGCITLATRTLYLNFSATLEVKNLFPSGARGTLDSLKAGIYQVTNQGDSSLLYATHPLPDPDEELWAWDTVYYKGHSLSGQCYRGKIAFMIGDTCEAHARPDELSVPTGAFL